MAIIFSDSWKTYKIKELQAARFENFKGKQPYIYVDPDLVHIYKTPKDTAAKWQNIKH